MIRNYFNIAVRNLLKYKCISFINLFGPTVGLACYSLIPIRILNELGYNRYNKDAGLIYRVNRSFFQEEAVVSLNLITIAAPFGYCRTTNFPDIQKMTRLLYVGTRPLCYQEKIFNEEHVFYAADNLFDVFPVNVLKGNPQKALNDPFSVMLKEETARKYVGTDDTVNKTLCMNSHI